MIIASLLIIVGLLFFVVTMSIYGWDFGKLATSGYVEHSYEPVGDFSSISIDTETADVSFALSTDGACRVVCFEKERVQHSVSISGGTLTIKCEDGRRWYDRIFDFGKDTVTVYLPESEYAGLSIKGHTGDVNIPADFAFGAMDISLDTGDVRTLASVAGDAKIKTSTGDVYLSALTLGSLDVVSSTGDVHIDKVSSMGAVRLERSTGNVYINELSAAGDTYIKVSTGDTYIYKLGAKSLTTEGDTGDFIAKDVAANEGVKIKRTTGETELDGMNVGGELSITATTGDIELSGVRCADLVTRADTGDLSLEDVLASGKFDIKSETGDVEFARCDAAEIYVDTETGDVEGSLLSDKVFIVKTTTGSVRVPDTITGGRCEITTTTGDVKITVG